MGADRGFVFAATGALYLHLARRTARNLRAVAPDALIDLFSDRAVDDPVFDRVHRLEIADHRPKMEALRRSRFDRTIYLDADVIATADPSDLFGLLDRADMAGVLELYGNSHNRANRRRPDIPPTFREVNSGVLACRKSARTDAFLDAWQQAFQASGSRIDQPLLREVLWDTPDLRVIIAPMEYNLMHVRLIRSYGKKMSAPRLLHVTGLHQESILATDAETPVALNEVMAEETRRALVTLIENDYGLGATPPFAHRVAIALTAAPKVQSRARTAYKWWRKLRR